MLLHSVCIYRNHALFNGRPAMKDFYYLKRKPSFHNRKLTARGMGTGSFQNVRLGGRNIGASMIMDGTNSGDTPGSCNINIYINNDVQGITNSILIGNKVIMGDLGVGLNCEEVLMDRGFPLVSKREGSSVTLLMVLVALIVMVLSVFAYLDD